MQWKTVNSSLTLALVLYAGASWGLFAKASDVKEVVRTQLDSAIWIAQKDKCLEPPGSKMREIQARRVADLVTQYYEATKEIYHLPSCYEFGGQG